jgi:hypothetical protein
MILKTKWIGEAIVVFSIDDLKIGVDPILCDKGTIQDYFWFKSTLLKDPVFEEFDFDDVDLWHITQSYTDQLNN